MDPLKPIIDELRRNEKVFAVYLFGGRAKNPKIYSDWDLCVFAEELTKEERNSIYATSNDFVDVVLFDDLPIWIRFNVFRDGKPIFIKDEDKIRRIKLITLKWYLDYGKYFEAKLYEKVRKAFENLGIPGSPECSGNKR